MSADSLVTVILWIFMGLMGLGSIGILFERRGHSGSDRGYDGDE